LLPDEACRESVLVAESYADGAASDQNRRTARNRISNQKAEDDLCATNARAAAYNTNQKTARRYYYFRGAAVAASFADGTGVCLVATLRSEEKAQADLMRCIFGPLPFRPITVDPSWLTSTVKLLAEAIYEERAFDRLPILADALEDAGYTNQDVLAHCRGSVGHCRGCWVVDLLLGKN
jgi:hypothetical protein